MPPAGRTHILFDFFGTLVDYSASRTAQSHARSHELLLRLGARLSYRDFLAAWLRTNAEFDRLSDQDDHEFAMTEVGAAFLATALGRQPAPADVEAFVVEYIGEWNTGVRYPAGITELVRELHRDHRLAVVTNTHRADLVPNHLEAMGLLPFVDAVITSVEVGWRKPHPTIYATALDALGIEARAAVFVGDTYGPDFAGPERAGMTAYLIDPHRRTPVPDARRLASIFDLPARLRAADASPQKDRGHQSVC
ncbi:MAG TPA: HAD family hydrolase [Pilimelia sp.]|nr:HAD family hydrolase [Pilimelia sp.]